MKNIILSVLLLCQLSSSENTFQISGVYSCDIKSSIFNTCVIVFFKTNEYYIEFENEPQKGSDDIGYFPFSYGIYKASHDTILLIDKINNYKIVLKKYSNSLKVIQSFKWMQSCEFSHSLSPSSNWINSKVIYKDKTLKILQKKKTFKKTGSQFIKSNLHSGKYSNESGYKLELNNKNYKFTILGFILSEGMWEKRSNNLILRDSNLKAVFKLLIINDHKLISSYLPGDFEGIAFEFSP